MISLHSELYLKNQQKINFITLVYLKSGEFGCIRMNLSQSDDEVDEL